MLLGLWGGLIPFVGPYFDYAFGPNSTWHYTTDRLWLNILPGAVALIAGLRLLTARSRSASRLGGWLAVLAGTWFVIGPAVSLTWETGAGPIGPPLYDSTRQMLELVGYFYLLGAVIVFFGAVMLGRFAPVRALGGPPVAAEPPAGVGDEPFAAQAGQPRLAGAPPRQARTGRIRAPFRRRERERAQP